MSNVRAWGGIFPISEIAAGVLVDSHTGEVEFAFPSLAQGQEAQVSVVVPDSPAGVAWVVSKNGMAIGGMVGNTPFGAIYASSGDVLTVTGVSWLSFVAGGLAPGTAVLLGSQGPSGSLGSVAPVQGGGYPSGLSLASIAITADLTDTGTFNVSANARGVIINVLPGTGAIPSVSSSFDDELGPCIPISTGALQVQGGDTAVGGDWFVATLGSPTLDIHFSAPTEYIIYEVDFDFDLPALARHLPAYNVTVSNPLAGADWSFTLAAPQRLIGAIAVLTSSATASNRYPRLVTGSLETMMTNAAQTAGLGIVYSGFLTAGAANSTDIATTGVVSFPIPDQLLPAGAVIESITTGIEAADQWSQITLVFAGA